MPGTPGDAQAAEYVEALMGLSWQEEYLQQPVRRGDMAQLYHFVTKEIRDTSKKHTQDEVPRVRMARGY